MELTGERAAPAGPHARIKKRQPCNNVIEKALSLHLDLEKIKMR